MTEFVLKHKKPSEIFEIVYAMREAGMVQGIDFDFAYNKAKFLMMVGRQWHLSIPYLNSIKKNGQRGLP